MPITSKWQLLKKLINKEEISSNEVQVEAKNNNVLASPDTTNMCESLKHVITSGVNDFAEQFSCFWLIQDITIFLSTVYQIKKEWFYSVVFSQKTGKSVLTFDDGNNHILYTYTYDFVDLTVKEDIKFFLAANDDHQNPSATFVLMLPSEY